MPLDFKVAVVISHTKEQSFMLYVTRNIEFLYKFMDFHRK
jgi:hypothetical protein